MRLFEVPYNFDEAIIPFYQKYASYINFLYLPPYKDDAENTRTSIQTNTKGHCYMPQSRKEYEKHIHLIINAGLRFVILWQLYDNIISNKMLKYYCSLYTSGFIVANDKNAEIIKQYNPNLIVICSIVQRIGANIMNKNLCNYDYVILYYPFNRALNALKQLSHIRDKIILMPNTLCNIDCPSIHHWFPSKEHPFIGKRDCCMTIDNLAKCGFIFPEHLKFFDYYVGGYKLQGREYSTPVIKYICHFYFLRTYYKDFIDPFLSKAMASKLKKLIAETPIDKYYNSKTITLIKYL